MKTVLGNDLIEVLQILRRETRPTAEYTNPKTTKKHLDLWLEVFHTIEAVDKKVDESPSEEPSDNQENQVEEKYDGGPAFPTREPHFGFDGDCEYYDSIDGMSLRDYIAVHATDKDVDEYAPWPRTKARYRFADDMIKERSKK